MLFTRIQVFHIPSQTPKPSPRKQLANLPEPSLNLSRTASPPQGGVSHGPLEKALERMQLKSPARHNSYSDSSGEDEEVEEAFSLERSRQNWEQIVYQTPASNPGLGRYDSTGQLDNTFQSAFYSPDLSMTRSDLNNRYLIPQIKSLSPATHLTVITSFYVCIYF